MPSLQDQLLKAGMVNEKKAKQIQKQKRKQAKAQKQQPKGEAPVTSDSKDLAQKARAERVAKDKARNKEIEQAAQEKAIAAQIRQLIETNKIDRGNGDIAYQFTHGKKIRKLYVTAALQTQLVNGVISIVLNIDQYELVPSPVAEKIKQRNDSAVLVQNVPDKTDGEIDEDDPYADYQIPDDLMW